MTKVLVFYGSYRPDRVGIRLAEKVVVMLNASGAEAELIDAKAVNLPMLERVYKDYPAGEAPPAMAEVAQKILSAQAIVLVAGEYNGGPQPGLKNLVDHYFSEWKGKVCGVITYSGGRLAGVKSGYAWGAITDKLGLIRIPGAPEVAALQAALDPSGEPIGEEGARLLSQLDRYLPKLLSMASMAQPRD